MAFAIDGDIPIKIESKLEMTIVASRTVKEIWGSHGSAVPTSKVNLREVIQGDNFGLGHRRMSVYAKQRMSPYTCYSILLVLTMIYSGIP